MQDQDRYERMTKAAANFSRLEAASIIAGEIIHIARKHK